MQKNIYLQIIQKTHNKKPGQIPAASYYRIFNAEEGAEYPLCGRASRVRIKSKVVTKQNLLKL